MTLLAPTISLDNVQHVVLEEMSWEFYEHLLEEIGDRHIRVTFDNGRMEIMSPLPRHEYFGQWIARLLEMMCLDRNIVVRSLGSTTFRSEQEQKGLEPDKCFYIQHADEALKMDKAFNPDVDPVPDLALEMDITSRSVPREPIYAALGVPELWRCDGTRLDVLHLSPKGKYVRRARSLAFPFLPMAEFSKFVFRLKDRDQIRVLRDFRNWLAKLPS
jgi:Uma2 family endonuclease